MLVILIKLNTTFLYLERRQRARKKIDKSNEAMLNDDDSKQS